MIRHFINLQFKEFFRSATFGKGLALKALMIFLGIYFMVMFVALGVSLYPILKKLYPSEDPFEMANKFLFYWILADLMMRFFLQKLPVMQVKPFLTLPVKRKNVVNYVLGKSMLSFFNFLPLFAAIPFGSVLIYKGYAVTGVVLWILLIALISLTINFVNFIIEAWSSEIELSFLPILVIVGVLFALDNFNIISFKNLIFLSIQSILDYPILIVIPILLLVFAYYTNFKLLYNNLYLDVSLQSKSQEVKTLDMGWTRRFGDVAPFMQLDLKLIWRNKRSRSSVFILIIGLLYGLFFYPNPAYANMPWIFAFVGVFCTGVFLINFGQFIPAWDSAYYKLLMSQNIKYEKYLKSKFTLMVFSVVVMFILTIPYVYFGYKILLAHFAGAVYNIGVNSHVILYGGSFNRKKIDLSQRAAFNFQGTGAVQWIIGLPLMILPLVIFGIVYWLSNFLVSSLVLIALGVIGIVLHPRLIKGITKSYQNSKYKMIEAFSQD